MGGAPGAAQLEQRADLGRDVERDAVVD